LPTRIKNIENGACEARKKIKDGIKMKKLMIVMVILLAFLTTGCSVQLTTSNEIVSKADILEVKGEEIQSEFNKALNFANELSDKNAIDAKDQKRIADQIDDVLNVIEEFKVLEVPVLGGQVKDFVENNLKQREEILRDVKEKAEKGTAEKEDLNKLEEALTNNDISIRFFY
jgi:hypothetical protein